MAFLTPADMKSHMYAATIAAITENDDTILPQAIAAAVVEAVSYLSRFDTDDLLSKTDTDRDPLLLAVLKSLTVWHFIPLANPNIDYDDAKLRYQQGIKWLEKVQASKTVPKGWLLIADPDSKGLDFEFKVASNQVKRTNSY